MRVHVVHAHPSEHSFTAEVRDAFLAGLADAGHSATVSDLYAMGFVTDMSEQEYLRDAHYDSTPAVADDVLAEQTLINAADALVFIYPVFWTEAPAKLVGWFNRVWSYGFAYAADGSTRTMKQLQTALFLCVAGHTAAELEAQGRLASMRNVMLDDRIHDRAVTKDLVVLGGTDRHDLARREANRAAHLARARALGAGLGG